MWSDMYTTQIDKNRIRLKAPSPVWKDPWVDLDGEIANACWPGLLAAYRGRFMYKVTNLDGLSGGRPERTNPVLCHEWGTIISSKPPERHTKTPAGISTS